MRGKCVPETFGLFAYADAYAEMLREENTVPWLKSSSNEQGKGVDEAGSCCARLKRDPMNSWALGAWSCFCWDGSRMSGLFMCL